VSTTKEGSFDSGACTHLLSSTPLGGRRKKTTQLTWETCEYTRTGCQDFESFNFAERLNPRFKLKWVTRKKAKVDRIACPWLIRKFVDADAEFMFVPADQVLDIARREGAIPFDTPGAELTHYKVGGTEYVTFDAIIKKYSISDPALQELAKIVRGADAKIPNAPPESAGPEAIALGFRERAGDDFENMRLQFPVYDALYEYCRLKLEGKTKLEQSL